MFSSFQLKKPPPALFTVYSATSRRSASPTAKSSNTLRGRTFQQRIASGNNSVENPPTYARTHAHTSKTLHTAVQQSQAIKMAPMFEFKKKIMKETINKTLVAVSPVGMLSAVLKLPAVQMYTRPDVCSPNRPLTCIHLFSRKSYRSSRWRLAARHT